MRVSMVGLAAVMAAGLATADGWAQCQQARIAPEDASGSSFGAGVALSGDVMLVGAYSGRGAAYVFRWSGDTWMQEKKILPPEDVAGGSFGLDVDLDGDTALIGAYQDSVDGVPAGAAYVYRYDGADWLLEATLTAPEPGALDQFGGDVALDGDVAVVGARYEGEGVGVGMTGAAHVYRRTGTTWTHEQALLPATPSWLLLYGDAVAVQGDVVVVGATDSYGPGYADVYTRGEAGWSHDATLEPSTLESFDDFGRNVVIDGDVLIASGRESGVSVFRKTDDTWQLEDTWTSASSGFGWHLAIEGDTVVADSFYDKTFGWVVSVREYDAITESWTETARLVPSNRWYSGASMAILGSTVVGGRASDDAVYVFDLLDPLGVDCDGNGECDAIEMRLGGDCNGNEQLDVCEGLLDTDGDGLFDPCDNCPDHANPDQANCDGDGPGDVCTLAEGLDDDCNENGVPDGCEFDCNRNGVPDDCDLAAGTSEDCNADGRPDECDRAYAVDDGDAEATLGYPAGPGRSLWMNGFTVAPDERTLIALGIVWFESPVGRPGAVMLYEDPNDDGDPNDARLVLSVDVETAPSGPDEYTIVPIPPTVIGEVGERFFVAAVVTHESADNILAVDRSSPERGESWATFLADDPSDLVDLSTLERPLVTDTGAQGNWMLRAYAGVGVVTCGDVNGDGVVDTVDLLTLVANWGPCATPCPPTCDADLDGSCQVGFKDLLILLRHWSG